MKNLHLLYSVAAVSAVVLLAGCGGGNSPAAPVTATGQYGPLLITLSAKASYALGEQVPLTLTVANSQTQAVQAFLGTADAKISRDSQLTWQLTKTTGASDGEALVTFKPGEVHTYTVTWDQKDLQGDAVPAGQYSARVWVNSGSVNGVTIPSDQQENAVTTPPIVITVR